MLKERQVIEPAKKRPLEEALAEFKRSPEARKTQAPIFEAALRDRERLAGYGLVDALRSLSKISGQDFGSGISEAEMEKFAFVVLFTCHPIEDLERRFNPSINN